jgi:hypothetical protein
MRIDADTNRAFTPSVGVRKRRWVMILRIRYRQLGGHIHCRVFTALADNRNFGKVGNLIFSEDEWPTVRRDLCAAVNGELVVQILPEDES